MVMPNYSIRDSCHNDDIDQYTLEMKNVEIIMWKINNIFATKLSNIYSCENWNLINLFPTQTTYDCKKSNKSITCPKT